jgi:hypothetical protein
VRVRDRRAVIVTSSARAPGEVDSLIPGDAVHRTIVYDDDPGPAAREQAAERGIEVIDPSTLGPALGELLLLSPLVGEEDPELRAALETPFAVLPEGARIVRPRIERPEAETMAGGDSRRFTLRLIPYYVAPYRVRPASLQGPPGPVLDRTVAVQAIARRTEIWESGDRELVAALDVPHQFLSPEIGVAEASGLAVDAIRRHHTVHVDHTEQHGGALVIETRRVPPGADDIRVGPLELIYVPHWYAEGTDGRVVLDAVTGLRVGAPSPPG